MPEHTGWVALRGRVVGGPSDPYRIVYDWDDNYYESRGYAISAGFDLAESDDFNVARVENGRLVWFGWMDEPHEEDDWPREELAERYGWVTADD